MQVWNTIDTNIGLDVHSSAATLINVEGPRAHSKGPRIMNLIPTIPQTSDFVVVCSWQHHTDAWNPSEPKKQPVIGLTVISRIRLKKSIVVRSGRRKKTFWWYGTYLDDKARTVLAS